MFSYHRPASTEEALSILSREACVPLAGGTDFYPARVGKPIQENVMDLTGIRSLRGIEERAEGIWMGALTTWTDVMHADLPEAHVPKIPKQYIDRALENGSSVARNLQQAGRLEAAYLSLQHQTRVINSPESRS